MCTTDTGNDRTSKGLRERWEIAVLCPELDELREEGEGLVRRAHGDGAAGRATDRDEPEDDVDNRQDAVDARSRRRGKGSLGGFTMLEFDRCSFHHGDVKLGSRGGQPVSSLLAFED